VERSAAGGAVAVHYRSVGKGLTLDSRKYGEVVGQLEAAIAFDAVVELSGSTGFARPRSVLGAWNERARRWRSRSRRRWRDASAAAAAYDGAAALAPAASSSKLPYAPPPAPPPDDALNEDAGPMELQAAAAAAATAVEAAEAEAEAEAEAAQDDRDSAGAGDGTPPSVVACKSRVEVSINVPRPLTRVPRPLLRSTASTVLGVGLSLATPYFLSRLASDFEAWTEDEADEDGAAAALAAAAAAIPSRRAGAAAQSASDDMWLDAEDVQ